MQLLLFINQEISRLFRTRRGLVVFVLFIVLWLMMMQYPMKWLYEKSLVTPNLINLQGEFLAPEFEGISRWPSLLTASIWFVGLYVFPTIPIVLCTDLLVSDLQRGTVRFLALRARRRDLLLGRFIGQTVNLTIFVGIGVCITFAFLKSWGMFDPAKEWFALMFSGLNFVLLSLPILGLVTMVSTFATTPRRVMIWTLLLWSVGGSILNWISTKHVLLDGLTILIPGAHLPSLMTLYGFATLKLAYIPLLQTAIFLSSAIYVLNREDL